MYVLFAGKLVGTLLARLQYITRVGGGQDSRDHEHKGYTHGLGFR